MPDKSFKFSSKYRPGEPLREWSAAYEFAPIDLRLLLNKTNSEAPLRRLVEGKELADSEIVSLARLNTFSVIQWREPPTVILYEEVRVHPEVIWILESMG